MEKNIVQKKIASMKLMRNEVQTLCNTNDIKIVFIWTKKKLFIFTSIPFDSDGSAQCFFSQFFCILFLFNLWFHLRFVSDKKGKRMRATIVCIDGADNIRPKTNSFVSVLFFSFIFGNFLEQFRCLNTKGAVDALQIVKNVRVYRKPAAF